MFSGLEKVPMHCGKPLPLYASAPRNSNISSGVSWKNAAISLISLSNNTSLPSTSLLTSTSEYPSFSANFSWLIFCSLICNRQLFPKILISSTSLSFPRFFQGFPFVFSRFPFRIATVKRQPPAFSPSGGCGVVS